MEEISSMCRVKKKFLKEESSKVKSHNGIYIF